MVWLAPIPYPQPCPSSGPHSTAGVPGTSLLLPQVHQVILERLPNRLTRGAFAKRLYILAFHFILKSGKDPLFWTKCQQPRVLRCLRPQDLVPGNSLQVARLAHDLMQGGAGRPPCGSLAAAVEAAKGLAGLGHGPLVGPVVPAPPPAPAGGGTLEWLMLRDPQFMSKFVSPPGQGAQCRGGKCPRPRAAAAGPQAPPRAAAAAAAVAVAAAAALAAAAGRERSAAVPEWLSVFGSGSPEAKEGLDLGPCGRSPLPEPGLLGPEVAYLELLGADPVVDYNTYWFG